MINYSDLHKRIKRSRGPVCTVVVVTAAAATRIDVYNIYVYLRPKVRRYTRRFRILIQSSSLQLPESGRNKNAGQIIDQT